MGVCGASWDDGGTLSGAGYDSVARWELSVSDASCKAEDSERMGIIRHDRECGGVVFGLVRVLSDWEYDGPDRSKFGLLPRAPRGQLERRRLVRALGLEVQARPG